MREGDRFDTDPLLLLRDPERRVERASTEPADMTTIATRTEQVESGRPRRVLGLSGRLILLTIAFVLMAEILVFIPSLAAFRRSWISDRLSAAQMTAVLLSAYPAGSPLPED